MKRGVILPQHDASPGQLFEAAEMAESAGLDSVWLIDHLEGQPKRERPLLECWSALAAVAARTEKVTVGTMILRVGLRNPRVLSAMARTALEISAGRLILALGIGDASVTKEQSAYGMPLKRKAERIEELSRTIAALRLDAPDVEIWVGGTHPDLFVVVDKVDGWNFWVPVDDFAREAERLVAAAGNTKMSTVTWAGYWPGAEGAETLRAAGADHLIVATGAANYAERIVAVASVSP